MATTITRQAAIRLVASLPTVDDRVMLCEHFVEVFGFENNPKAAFQFLAECTTAFLQKRRSAQTA